MTDEERQTIRVKRLIDIAKREGDNKWASRLAWAITGSPLGKKDQGIWKPKLKENWND